MSVLETLAREHRVFEALVGRLESALKYPEDLARSEWRKIFLVLLPALDRHEEIENIVFEDPACLSKEGSRRLLGEVERQHGNISLLRRDVLEALQDTGLPGFPHVGSLISQLAWRLRDHFRAEETRLWPHYRKAMSRSLDRSISRRVGEKLRQLKRDVSVGETAVADYIG